MELLNTTPNPPAAVSVLESRYCTLCGPEAAKNVKFAPRFREEDLNAEIFSARRSPDRCHFRLVECGRCGIIYSDPACDPGRLARLYEEGLVNYGTQEEQIYQSYAPILDRALPQVGNRGTFLEIGGGAGFMLRYGVEHGFARQIEIEPSADAERRFRAPGAQARFIRGIFTQGALPPGSVSFACFFQMLDHVPDPRRFLADVYEVLEPGGIAVCVTHNTRAWSARLLGERSPIYDIEHTYLFNPDNMEKLFAQAGLEPVESFGVANRYALKYWANLAPLPRPAKKLLLPTLEIVGLGNLPIRLRAGNFGIVGRKGGPPSPTPGAANPAGRPGERPR